MTPSTTTPTACSTDPSAPAATPAGIPLGRPLLRDDHLLLWRGETCLQISDGPRAVVLTDVDRGWLTWVRSLDGLRSTATAIADAAAAGLTPHRAGWLLRMLWAAGALDDAAVAPQSLRAVPPPVRLRLAPDVAAAGHVHRDPEAVAAAMDRRHAARVRVLGRGRVADAVTAALRCTGVPVLTVPEPTADDSGASTATLDVLADHHHPDVPDDHGALVDDRVHLPVAAHGRLARIGPLVIPGRTSCLRCADLHRADRDPSWPRVAVQLAHRRPATPPVDAALALAVGALAALQVVAWIEGPPASDASRSGATAARDAQDRGEDVAAGPGDAVELTLPGGAVRRVHYPPHPLCGCHWRLAG